MEIPLPELRDDDVLVKVKACGVCGTDLHIHEGEFIAKFPLIPGHETVGVIAAVGKVSAYQDPSLGKLSIYLRKPCRMSRSSRLVTA